MSDQLFPGGEPEPLLDSEELTQYGREGTSPVFRDAPRSSQETELSMLRGHLSAAEAAIYVRKRSQADDRDQVRYTTVGRLRDLGFEVTHTPSRRNPDHVSVRVPEGRVPWEDAERGAFVKAFDPAATGGAA